MRDFACPNCGQRLAFENSVCLSCGSPIGFDLAARDFAVLGPQGVTLLTPARQICANLNVAGCNWLVPVGGSALCRSCSLTRTRPNDGDPALPAFAEAEAAKRRLVVELIELSLPINDRIADPERGLTFDLLSSEQEPVITGHDEGVITLDLAEGDDVHREQLRVSMDEPYRTLLGHFRHETGHYFFFVLAETGPARAEFETLFGDPDLDYQEALDEKKDSTGQRKLSPVQQVEVLDEVVREHYPEVADELYPLDQVRAAKDMSTVEEYVKDLRNLINEERSNLFDDYRSYAAPE